MKLIKLSAILSCLVLSTMLVGCVEELTDGGDTGFCADSQSNACANDSDCSGGQRCASVGGQTVCVDPCGSDSDCDSSCLDFGDDGNNDTNNDVNNDENNDINNDQNNDVNNDGPNNDGGICQDACQQVADCLDQVCTMQIIDVAACTQQCEADPAAFGADQILLLSCQELNDALLDQFCAEDPNIAQVCECPVIEPQETDTGEPCAADADCEAGNLQPFCFTEVDAMTGEESGFAGGYCTAVGCQADEQCGENNICVQIDQQGTTICLAGCDPANNGEGDCREGYACPDLSQGQGVGACIPACTEDADCGEGGTCDVETGQCQ